MYIYNILTFYSHFLTGLSLIFLFLLGILFIVWVQGIFEQKYTYIFPFFFLYIPDSTGLHKTTAKIKGVKIWKNTLIKNSC